MASINPIRLISESKAGIDLSVIAEGRRAVKGSRIGVMIDSDMCFHNLTYSASGNTLIAERGLSSLP